MSFGSCIGPVGLKPNWAMDLLFTEASSIQFQFGQLSVGLLNNYDQKLASGINRFLAKQVFIKKKYRNHWLEKMRISMQSITTE